MQKKKKAGEQRKYNGMKKVPLYFKKEESKVAGGGTQLGESRTGELYASQHF